MPYVVRCLLLILKSVVLWLLRLSLKILEESLRVGIGLIAGFLLAIWIGLSTLNSWFPLLVNAGYALLKFFIYFVRLVGSL